MTRSAWTATQVVWLALASSSRHCLARRSTESASSIEAGSSPTYAPRQDATCTSAMASASSGTAGLTSTPVLTVSTLGGTLMKGTYEAAVGRRADTARDDERLLRRHDAGAPGHVVGDNGRAAARPLGAPRG